MTKLNKHKSFIFEQKIGGEKISSGKNTGKTGGDKISSVKTTNKTGGEKISSGKSKPSVSPVTDDETTKKVDSKEDLTSIRVTDIEDYPTDKLKIKLFRTRFTQEPKGFVRDYDFIEAIQKALENKDTNKNLSGSNFVPGW